MQISDVTMQQPLHFSLKDMLKSKTMLKFKPDIRMGMKGDLSKFECGQNVPDGLSTAETADL